MTAVRELLVSAADSLRAAGVPSPEADARLLLAHVLDRTPATLLLVDTVDEPDRAAYADLVERRATRVPLQHLTGRAPFRHLELAVGPGAFVPRPETEAMAGWVIDALRDLDDLAGRRVVDLCAGSGAIAKAVATELPGPTVYAVELSEDAAAWAERNLADTDVQLVVADMAVALHELDGTVDIVVANPPYIPLEAYATVAPEARDHDPTVALFSGADGLDAIRTLVGTAARLLRPGGLLAFEHAEVQAESAPQVVVRSGAYERVRDHPDLTGRPRFTTAVRRSDATS